MHVYNRHAWYDRAQKTLDAPELKLQMIVSQHEGAENRTLVLTAGPSSQLHIFKLNLLLFIVTLF